MMFQPPSSSPFQIEAMMKERMNARGDFHAEQKRTSSFTPRLPALYYTVISLLIVLLLLGGFAFFLIVR